MKLHLDDVGVQEAGVKCLQLLTVTTDAAIEPKAWQEALGTTCERTVFGMRTHLVSSRVQQVAINSLGSLAVSDARCEAMIEAVCIAHHTGTAASVLASADCSLVL